MMRGSHLVATCLALALFGFHPKLRAQESAPPPPPPGHAAGSDIDGDTVFRVNVDMVQLNVAVIDRKGNYVTGLRPSDFEIIEDTIPQKMATFEEGNLEPIMLLNPGQPAPAPSPSTVAADSNQERPAASPRFNSAGSNVFILFDTSNYRSEEHTSELQSHVNLVCRLL